MRTVICVFWSGLGRGLWLDSGLLGLAFGLRGLDLRSYRS